MEPQPNRTPLVVIVGETASGKSALALALAQKFNGEIIAADSRTLYLGIDIGTAKPTAAERAIVPHHLLDITNPDRPITAAEYKRLAYEAIEDVLHRGKVPFLVGGTGLYIDAVVYDFSFASKGDDSQRQKWQELSAQELAAELVARKIPLPTNRKNPRHLVRRLEIGENLPESKKIRPNTLILGLSIGRDKLEDRVSSRVDKMFAQGLEDEVTGLVNRYGWESASMQTIGYQEFQGYLSGEITIVELKALIKTHTLQYAKRQRSWFRRNKSIQWISKEEEAVDFITTFLNK